MKVKIRDLVTKLLPLLNQIGDLQKRGVVALSQKAGYAIAKNFNQGVDLTKHFEHKRLELVKVYVELGKDGQPLMDKKENGNVDYVFFSDEKRTKFISEIDSILDQEVEFTPHKFSSEELENCHNIPVDILATLEDFKIITEVSLQIPVKKL